MIKAVQVHKSYRLGDDPVYALRGVDLEISESGFYAIMGASGSGKSTFLHLLGGLDRPDQGEIHVNGKRIDGLDERALTRFRRHEVGIVFQQFNLIATMTARENVELPGMLASRPESEIHKRSALLLESLGMTHRADHRPDALSGGEQQRIAIARSLFFQPRLLLADEPTGNLDSRSSEQLWSLLADLARDHSMTVVMVTHEPAAAAHCRKAFVLHDGTNIGSINTDGLDASSIAAEYQRLSRTA